jgi:hypothetical protein
LEKFEIDMKWGSYLFMANIIASIFIALLMFLIDRNSTAYIIILVAVFQLFYFTIKAIRENKKHGLSKGVRKIFVFFRVLIFSYLLSSFLRMTSEVDAQPFSLLFPHRKKNLSEFLIEEDLDEREGITLNDLIPKFKKFARLITI